MLPVVKNDMRILIVKDEPLVLKSLESKLKREGFNVILCTRIEDALNAINEKNIHVVITGLTFSEASISAIDIIRECKSILPPKPIIIISKKVGEEDIMQEAIECGADDCLYSPIKLNELVVRLNYLLRNDLNRKSVSVL